MNKQTDSFDKALDLLLDEAAEGANEAIGNALDERTEEHIFSQEHEDKMQKLFKAEKRKLWLQKTAKYAKRAACFLAVILVTLGVAIGSVDAWRTRFLNFVLEVGEPNTDYNFGKTSSASYMDQEIALYYVPKGFQLSKRQAVQDILCLIFENDEQYFQIDLQPIDVNSSIDTEDGVVEQIVIKDEQAIYISNPRFNAVIWHDGEVAYSVLGTIEKEKLVKIAENIVKY